MLKVFACNSFGLRQRTVIFNELQLISLHLLNPWILCACSSVGDWWCEGSCPRDATEEELRRVITGAQTTPQLLQHLTGTARKETRSRVQTPQAVRSRREDFRRQPDDSGRSTLSLPR
uniref:Uncharacterized protein n=1 Tax=Zea mays TaxID=4577 RepID=C4J055_MAIZE|nr:unknown [Zea mays]